MDIKSIVESIKNDDKLGNSFSQSVYLIDKDKILKMYNNLDKGKNEFDYLDYFNGNLNVPSVLNSGMYDNRFYIIMNYIEGENYTDEEDFTLDDEMYKKIGTLLGNMHSLDPLKEDTWKEYMLYRVERNYEFLKSKNVNLDIDSCYNYLKDMISTLSYESHPMHADFRMGNLILGDEPCLIDLESVKSGDPVFDFVKLYRIFPQDKFSLFKEGYESVRKLDFDFSDRLHFYNLYDSFTTMGWCIEVDRYESDFYNFNKKFFKEEMNYLCEKGVIQKEESLGSSSLKK